LFTLLLLVSGSNHEVPIWFFPGGPTSQHDTIELRGFEDIPEEQVARGVSKKQSALQSKIGKSGNNKKIELDFIHLFHLLLFILYIMFLTYIIMTAVKVEFVVFVFCGILLCCQSSV
jgi:Nucleocytoplasmic shuttling protein for mRNA cap-binding EIF4E.